MRTAQVLVFGLLISAPGPVCGATQQEAETGLASAKQIEAEAGGLGNRWVPAETMLKAAQAALDAKDWDRAASAAAEAQALAQRAIEQSKEQKRVWHDAVIR